jgi:hypothetical protein
VNCRLIANGALRKLGILAAGREARPVDLNDAFDALKGLYKQLITNGAFGRLVDVIPVADYTAFENERIFRNNENVVSITLPETLLNWEYWGDWWIFGRYPYEPVPPATNAINLNVRTPRDCAVVSIIDKFTGLEADFIYDGQRKQWTGISALDLDDDAPLSSRDPQGLMALLAAQISDEYGRELGGATQRLAGNFQSGLTNRFSFCDQPVAMEYF